MIIFDLVLNVSVTAFVIVLYIVHILNSILINFLLMGCFGQHEIWHSEGIKGLLTACRQDHSIYYISFMHAMLRK